jgi:hypothetical protein
VASTGGSYSIASDGTNLVWLDGSGAVQEVPVGGGTVITLASLASGYQSGYINLASGVVAWSASHQPSSTDDNLYGAIFTATEGSANSGIPTPAAVGNMVPNVGSADTGGMGLRSNGGTGYFLSREDPSVESCPLGGIETSCTSIATATNGGVLDNLVLAGTTLYWTSFSTGSVFSLPIGGSTVTTIASGELGPFIVTTDSTYVYWVNYNQITNAYNIDRNVQTSPNPNASQNVLPAESWTINGMATDGRYVYYSGTLGASAVGYVPVAGGTPKTLYPLPNGGTGSTAVIAVGGAVYWADADENTIRGIAAPQ